MDTEWRAAVREERTRFVGDQIQFADVHLFSIAILVTQITTIRRGMEPIAVVAEWVAVDLLIDQLCSERG